MHFAVGSMQVLELLAESHCGAGIGFPPVWYQPAEKFIGEVSGMWERVKLHLTCAQEMVQCLPNHL
jgi:hypothetical protein